MAHVPSEIDSRHAARTDLTLDVVPADQALIQRRYRIHPHNLVLGTLPR